MNFQWFLHHLAIRVAMVEDAVVQILKQKFWCQTHIEPLRQTPGPEQLCECQVIGLDAIPAILFFQRMDSSDEIA